MRIDELADRVGLSRWTIKHLIRERIIPPARGVGRWATYGPEHVAAARAWKKLRHASTTTTELAEFLQDERITVVEYVRRREASIKAHGLGVA